MPTITVKDVKTHYREWGNSDTTLLMLHGWGADSTHYTEVGPTLAKAGYRVIVPDLPGFGSSGYPPKAWSISDYRNWLKALTEELGLKSFILFGHSFGGRISIKYSINFPYQLKALILCGSAGIKPNPATIKRKVIELTAEVGKRAFSLPGLKNAAPFARKVLYKLAGSRDYNEAQGVMKETIVKALEEDLTPLLGQISVPTFLLWGGVDDATPVSDGKKMNSLIKDSVFKVLEGERHNLPKYAPEKTAAEIESFLRENKRVIE